jgi:DNA-binding CsgD family transcriptional regulator/PAS domain-containing protein
MDHELVDRIYEATFLPEGWPDILSALGRTAQGTGGTLLIAKDDSLSWVASPGSMDRAARYVNEGWFWRGQLVSRAIAKRHAGFLTDLDLFTREELELEPTYHDFWKPQGIGWVVKTIIPLPTGENASLALTRRTERGPAERAVVQKLDELRPHLARSLVLSVRLQLDRARAASETLAALELPALVLDEQGKVVAANSMIENLTDYIMWRARDRMLLKDKNADQFLRDAIGAVDKASAIVRSFAVRNASDDAMMVAHLIPIRLSVRDIFSRCAAALVFAPVTMRQAPSVELVQALFDLTPVEARVARNLAAGKTVDDIAIEGGVSPNTIRTHVRGVLQKTGCRRQAEVVALLTGVSPPRM